jgi:hypothetical protein
MYRANGTDLTHAARADRGDALVWDHTAFI